MAQSFLRTLINYQKLASRRFDRLLKRDYWLDGNRDFYEDLLPKYLKPNLRVWDIGGGKRPAITPQVKQCLNLQVSGLDISQKELDAAPQFVYDKTFCADITTFRGKENSDLIICQALLEHVNCTRSTFTAINSILAAGGRALIFVPCRNALFARLNLLLPETWKRSLLFFFYPHARGKQAFKSFYDRCTPHDFRQLAAEHKFEIEEERIYFKSSYFTFFFPLHLLWRIWVIAFRAIVKDQAAETFSMVLRKRPYCERYHGLDPDCKTDRMEAKVSNANS